MKRFSTIAAILIFAYFPTNINSQGCSDAGVCTVHSIKTTNNADSTSLKNQFCTGVSYGSALFHVHVINSYLEYSRIINKKITTTLKLNYSTHSGDLATIYGFSDIMATANYKLNKSINLVGGVKIPLNDANLSENGLALPMSYQTILGTYDIITGISYSKSNYAVTLAYQHPIIQNNNQFFINDYPLHLIKEDYLSTNSYERSPDILLRLSHNHNFKNNKMVLISSILPIYHLGEDSFVDKQNMLQKIDGSEGLTLNLNIFYQYKITDSQTIELSVGAPIIARDIRPDGLGKFAIGLDYSVKF